MRFRNLGPITMVFAFAILMTVAPGKAQAQDVRLDGSDLQVVLDQLFGTTDADGLLEGTRPFQLHADNVVMTEAQASMFFSPTAENPADISDLILKAEAIKGAELKIEGSMAGEPFELKLSGKQAKIEGLVLTQAEFDALVAELRASPGLHEAKIEATVDGELLVAKLQNVPGRVKIEHHGFTDEGPHPVPLGDAKSGKRTSDVRMALVDRDKGLERSGRPEKLERVERPERVEKMERPEKIERVERPVKIEKIERPEVAHSGKGRG